MIERLLHLAALDICEVDSDLLDIMSRIILSFELGSYETAGASGRGWRVILARKRRKTVVPGGSNPSPPLFPLRLMSRRSDFGAKVWGMQGIRNCT
jgi:hypothetical protein